MGLIISHLRVLMAKRELNIQKVKDSTTLSRTTISNLYNNYGSGIKFDTLRQLCELLRCQPGDLLEYIEVEADFTVLEKINFDTFVETNNNKKSDESFEYISSVTADLKLELDFTYYGVNRKYTIYVTVAYEIDENNHLKEMYIDMSPELEYELYILAHPPNIDSFVYRSLENFLVDWGLRLDFIEGGKDIGIEYRKVK